MAPVKGDDREAVLPSTRTGGVARPYTLIREYHAERIRERQRSAKEKRRAATRRLYRALRFTVAAVVFELEPLLEPSARRAAKRRAEYSAYG